jgi:hypothetical protein
VVDGAHIIDHLCYAVPQFSMSDEKTEKLKSALRDSLGDAASEEVIQGILKTLDKQKVFRYHNEKVVGLLSTLRNHGRQHHDASCPGCLSRYERNND